MARGLKDKVPSGTYIVKVSILDRLGGNKMYYKFVEYHHHIRRLEKQYRKAKKEAS